MRISKPYPDPLTLAPADLAEWWALLVARIDELEGMHCKTSRNSSLPPSSDGLSKPKKTKSLRVDSGNKPGGQPGHKGATLRQVDTPTQIIPYPLPSHCTQCSCELPKEGARVKERRQVFEIPVMLADVIEHRTLEQQCQCGVWHTSEFPEGVTEPAQYGPNLRALGVHLHEGQLLPFARASQLINDLFGNIRVSPGSIVSWVGKARTALQGTADSIAAQLVRAPVAHADETGLRVEGELYWMHVVATEMLTWYGVHKKRGMEAIEAHGILRKRIGVLVHDCWQPYWNLDCVHALCNAHLLRELLYVKDVTGDAWPESMTELLLTANRICEAARKQDRTLDADDIAAFVTLYDSILDEGDLLHPTAPGAQGKRGRTKQSFAHNLLARLRKHTDAVLLFISNPDVPFTNNIAESGVRMPKIKQKISGCYRTLEGAENFCVIRSCLDTLRKQGHGMLEVLRRAFAGNPIQPACG